MQIDRGGLPGCRNGITEWLTRTEKSLIFG